MNARQSIIDRILNGGTMSTIESKEHPDIATIELEFTRLWGFECLSSFTETSFSPEDKNRLDDLRAQLKIMLLNEPSGILSTQPQQNQINTRQSIIERILHGGTMSDVEAKDHPDIKKIEVEFWPLLELQSIRSLIKRNLSPEEKKQLEDLRAKLGSMFLEKPQTKSPSAIQKILFVLLVTSVVVLITLLFAYPNYARSSKMIVPSLLGIISGIMGLYALPYDLAQSFVKWKIIKRGEEKKWYFYLLISVISGLLLAVFIVNRK